MRMIDRFRTPSQQKIIRWLEANHMGTMIDIAKDIGLPIGGYKRHFKKLSEDGVIHICGYVGYRNQKVYSLVRREHENH